MTMFFVGIDKIKEEIIDEWKMYALALVGTMLLFFGWLFFLFHETGISAMLTAIGGAIDIPICIKKIRTITQWVRKQFGKYLDRIILGISYGIDAYVILFKWTGQITAYDVVLAMVIACIKWHLFANEGQ